MSLAVTFGQVPLLHKVPVPRRGCVGNYNDYELGSFTWGGVPLAQSSCSKKRLRWELTYYELGSLIWGSAPFSTKFQFQFCASDASREHSLPSDPFTEEGLRWE